MHVEHTRPSFLVNEFNRHDRTPQPRQKVVTDLLVDGQRASGSRVLIGDLSNSEPPSVMKRNALLPPIEPISGALPELMLSCRSRGVVAYGPPRSTFLESGLAPPSIEESSPSRLAFLIRLTFALFLRQCRDSHLTTRFPKKLRAIRFSLLITDIRDGKCVRRRGIG
jgi:hypothetical protein